jgi:hypothetical protein
MEVLWWLSLSKLDAELVEATFDGIMDQCANGLMN